MPQHDIAETKRGLDRPPILSYKGRGLRSPIQTIEAMQAAWFALVKSWIFGASVQ